MDLYFSRFGLFEPAEFETNCDPVIPQHLPPLVLACFGDGLDGMVVDRMESKRLVGRDIMLGGQDCAYYAIFQDQTFRTE